MSLNQFLCIQRTVQWLTCVKRNHLFENCNGIATRAFLNTQTFTFLCFLVLELKEIKFNLKVLVSSKQSLQSLEAFLFANVFQK